MLRCDSVLSLYSILKKHFYEVYFEHTDLEVFLSARRIVIKTRKLHPVVTTSKLLANVVCSITINTVPVYAHIQ